MRRETKNGEKMRSKSTKNKAERLQRRHRSIMCASQSLNSRNKAIPLGLCVIQGISLYARDTWKNSTCTDGGGPERRGGEVGDTKPWRRRVKNMCKSIPELMWQEHLSWVMCYSRHLVKAYLYWRRGDQKDEIVEVKQKEKRWNVEQRKCEKKTMKRK